MNFSRKITSKVASLLTAAIFCTLSLTSAFAGGSKNNFEGKTYVMTGMFAGGMDITSLMGMAGVELKMEVTFVDSSTYKATVTSNGETEESTGEYTINAKEKKVTLLNKDSDNLDFTYSEDFSKHFRTYRRRHDGRTCPYGKEHGKGCHRPGSSPGTARD